VKPDVNIVEVHPQPTHEGPFSGWCAGSFWAHQCQVDTSKESVEEDYWKKEIVDTCPRGQRKDNIIYDILY